MLSDYVVTKDGELYHYGVKGMKWGVRRDYRVLANHRRNQAVRDAKKDYREGKISKSDRKEAIKKAKNYTKDFKKETKAQFKNAKTREEKRELNKQIKNQAKAEVGARGLKKGATTLNKATTVAMVSGTTVALGAAFIASPAVGPLILGAYGANVAANLGRQWLTQKFIDRVS